MKLSDLLNQSGSSGGSAPDATATASVLAPGSTPTATVSVIGESYAFAFGIPQGNKGDKGDTGAAICIVSTSAPLNPVDGTIWINPEGQ